MTVQVKGCVMTMLRFRNLSQSFWGQIWIDRWKQMKTTRSYPFEADLSLMNVTSYIGNYHVFFLVEKRLLLQETFFCLKHPNKL